MTSWGFLRHRNTPSLPWFATHITFSHQPTYPFMRTGVGNPKDFRQFLYRRGKAPPVYKKLYLVQRLLLELGYVLSRRPAPWRRCHFNTHRPTLKNVETTGRHRRTYNCCRSRASPLQKCFLCLIKRAVKRGHTGYNHATIAIVHPDAHQVK